MTVRETRVATGIPGLDEVLSGGLLSHGAYLVRGSPGSGKTTLGMHFLARGAAAGERVLFITLGESEASLRSNAQGVGIDCSKVDFLDLSPNSEFFTRDQTYELFSPAEVERAPITQKIVSRLKELKPKRVFLDSTSHIRYLSIDAHQFRKQLLSFIRFLMEIDGTVVFTSESTPQNPDDDVMYLSDGVINLWFENHGRRLQVTKFRGSDFRSGKHTFKLGNNGFSVFPVMLPGEHSREFSSAAISSGVPEIDRLLGGGIERGTVTLVTGPAGVGKTSLGLQIMSAAAAMGERSVLYAFEEAPEIIARRAERINIPLRGMLESEMLNIVPIEPLTWSKDEVMAHIRNEVEKRGARIVMIDSNAGFQLSLGDEPFLPAIRSMLKYLTNMGVTVFSINETSEITGNFRATETGLSFMVDNIVFIRYLELWGEMRKAIGVLKKRLSDFEGQLREFAVTENGLQVGAPLTGLRGVLQGVPEWVEKPAKGNPPQPTSPAKG